MTVPLISSSPAMGNIQPGMVVGVFSQHLQTIVC